MTAKQNPFGLHTVTPYLVVADVERLILFLQEVFSAELRGDIHYRDNGAIKHAEVTLQHYSWTTVLFPATIAFACGVLIVIVLVRRRKLGIPQNIHEE